MLIAVFCGFGNGADILYQSVAHELGQLIAFSGHTLVYGGSNHGCMGAVSTAALDAGGKVISVIPSTFPKEIIDSQPRAITHVVGSMQERKVYMVQHCDLFIALPGGVGTLDEITEVLMSNQLHLCNKPMILVNTNGYYDFFLQQLERCRQEGLLRNFEDLHLRQVGQIKDLRL